MKSTTLTMHVPYRQFLHFLSIPTLPPSLPLSSYLFISYFYNTDWTTIVSILNRLLLFLCYWIFTKFFNFPSFGNSFSCKCNYIRFYFWYFYLLRISSLDLTSPHCIKFVAMWCYVVLCDALFFIHFLTYYTPCHHSQSDVLSCHAVKCTVLYMSLHPTTSHRTDSICHCCAVLHHVVFVFTHSN